MSEQLNDHRGDMTAPLGPGGEQRLSSQREELYREIFENSPVAIWVEDWSRAKVMIDRLARRGVKDWRRYFERHPDQLIKAANLCEVVEVSQATLAIYRATSKEDVISTTRGETMSPDELATYREQLVAYAEGAGLLEQTRRRALPRRGDDQRHP